ncbi:hypothetical protein F5Y09DRAFT_351796 [Xylaria sp. FL1042]|nr:hypothetical protein F5Y09DRAFT_351796 [Xylaria sp. FL1042]
MPNAERKRRLDLESQSGTLGVKSDADEPKPKRPRLQGKRHTSTLGPKPDQNRCHGIKPEPPNDTLYYDFVNYLVTDLELSSTDLTTPATTPCLSSGDDFSLNATGRISDSDLEAPRPTINDSGDKGDLPVLGKTLPRTEPEGDLADIIRDVPSGDLSIGGLPRCDGSRGTWTALPRDPSSSDLPRTITSTTRNDLTGNTREPTAEPRAPECLPSRKQSVQEPGPPAITLDDGQCIVERLLGRQVVSRGKGRRKRMVVQYWVKWQGWSDEHNEWVDEDDIHEGLVAAYNSATAGA